MHPLALPHLAETRSSRRRARRAVIAVVAGLLATPATQAFADPMVQGPAGWHQPAPTHLPSGHHVTGGRTIPEAPVARATADGTSADWEIPAAVAAAAALVGGLTLTQRRRPRMVT
jgi:hypothetical protein